MSAPAPRALAGERSSLQRLVTTRMVATIGFLGLAQGTIGLVLYRRALDQQLLVKADAVASALAADSELKVGVWAGYRKGTDDRLEAALARVDSMRFALVLDDAGETVGAAARPGEDLAAVASRVHTNQAVADAVVAVTVIEDDTAAAPADDLGLLDPAAAAPGAAKGAAHKTARVVVGLDARPAERATWRFLAIAAAMLLVAAAGGVWLTARVFAKVFARMRHVRDVAQALAAGDLQTRVDDAGTDELGELAQAVERVRDTWSGIVGDMGAVADRVAGATRDIATDAHSVANGSAAQVDAAEGTARMSAAIVRGSEDLQRIVDAVAAIGRSSATALERTREAGRAVEADMERVLESLRADDSQRAKNDESIAQVGGTVAALDAAVVSATAPAEDVAQRMTEAGVAAKAVAAAAREGIARSGEVLTLLGRQQDRVSGVAEGAAATSRAAEELQAAVAEVLRTAADIRDVADMTAMLSLNAQIIAAQARGTTSDDASRGFGTIADEIRTLVARTRGATDAIERRGAEAQRQIEALTGVVTLLSQGVAESRVTTSEASEVVQQVLDHMGRTLNDAAALASLVQGAAQRTEASRVAVLDVAAVARRIEGAVAAQRDAQRQLQQAAALVRADLQRVRDTGKAQATSTSAMLEQMSRLAAATEELVSLARAQTRSAESIAGQTAQVRDVALAHRGTVDAIAGAVARVDGEAAALRDAIARFRERA